MLELKHNGTTVGLAPLVRRTSRRFFRMRKLGFVTHHSDYNDLLLGSRAEEHWSAFAEFLARKSEDWEFADFRELRNTDEGTKPLELALRQAGLFFRVFSEDEGCPFLKIQGGAAESMKRLSGHVRRTLRRRMERAQADGLTVCIIERPDLEPGLIDALSSLDIKKQAHRESPTFFAAHPDAFRDLFAYFGPKNGMYVALLKKEKQPVAFQLGFRCGSKLWDYTKAYDRSFSRYAPGTLLLPALLDYCAEHGFEEYDFLRGEEEYKLLWSSGVHRRSRVVVWNRRWASRVSAALFLRYRAPRSMQNEQGEHAGDSSPLM